MDIAAVFERLCALPIVRRRLEHLAGRALTDDDIGRLAALVYLHDMGKLLAGFQAKARPKLKCPADVNHSQAGAALLNLLDEQRPEAMAPIPERLRQWGGAVAPLMRGIFAHHGRPVEVERVLPHPLPVEGYDLPAAMRCFTRMWLSAFPLGDTGEPLPDNPAFVHLVTGLTALADWIGSDRHFFRYVAQPGPGYPDEARRAPRRRRSLTQTAFCS